MLCKVTHCAGRVSANTRPHQLRWGDQEMGTAISCTECSQVAGRMHMLYAPSWSIYKNISLLIHILGAHSQQELVATHVHPQYSGGNCIALLWMLFADWHVTNVFSAMENRSTFLEQLPPLLREERTDYAWCRR